MKNFAPKTVLILLALLFGASATVSASVIDEEEYICPLDGTQFEALVAFSGTSFGAQLDLKRIGAIAQPWPMPQCPKCKLPLFKEKFTDAEKKELQKIVSSEKFIKESKDRSAYYALALIKEVRKEPAFDSAWTYLQASWQYADDAKVYREIALRAKDLFSQAATPQLKKKSLEEYELAVYLPIELSRRVGDFESASKYLEKAKAIQNPKLDWLPLALKLQEGYIKAKDSNIRNLEEEKPEKEMLPALEIGPTENDYVVVAGDTVWAISKKHSLTPEQLRELNPEVNLQKLSIGQILRIKK